MITTGLLPTPGELILCEGKNYKPFFVPARGESNIANDTYGWLWQRDNQLPLSSPYLLGQQGWPCYGSLKWPTGSYDSKVSPVGPLITERLAPAVFPYEYNVGFPASLSCDSCNLHFHVLYFQYLKNFLFYFLNNFCILQFHNFVH